jgi:CheY-like chemotaxis protein
MASRILLADDSITIQKVVNLTFADEGIEVVAVSNGEMAEKRLGEINPDLVLADIFMPGKNGYELCEYIKQSPQFCKVPVVLLVGAFEPFDQAEARRVKADTHLTKPFESRVLVETVRRLIDKGEKPSTGSLGSMAPASPDLPATPSPVEESSHVEHRIETRSMASPLLNIDLNAMSGPASQADTSRLDPAGVTSASGFQTLNENSPLDLDYGSFAQEPGGGDFRTQEQSQPFETMSQFSPDTYRQTLQLASLSAQEQAEMLASQQGETRVCVEDIPSEPQPDVLNDVLGETEVSERWQQPRAGTPSAFGYSPQEMILDFDRVQSLPAPGPENVTSLDLDISVSSPQEAASAAEPPVEDELDTGKLEPPVRDAAHGEADDEGEADTPRTIGPVTSLLLSADNPLDVLFDERPQEAAESRVSDVSSGIAEPGQDLDSMAPLSPVEGYSTLEMASDAQTAHSVTDEQEADAALAYGSDSGFDAFSTVSEEEAEEETLASEWQPVGETVGSGVEVSGGEVAETAYEYERAAQDSLSSEMDDEKFSSAPLWSEAETHFTPIDIEAVPVTEPAIPPVSEAGLEETGFEFKPVDEGRPASGVTADETARPVAAETPAQATPGLSAELSPELIDEIVRRIVAQMSDRVVREIAWEVVPDCVERIIKEMARDSLSKGH